MFQHTTHILVHEDHICMEYKEAAHFPLDCKLCHWHTILEQSFLNHFLIPLVMEKGNNTHFSAFQEDTDDSHWIGWIFFFHFLFSRSWLKLRAHKRVWELGKKEEDHTPTLAPVLKITLLLFSQRQGQNRTNPHRFPRIRCFPAWGLWLLFIALITLRYNIRDAVITPLQIKHQTYTSGLILAVWGI